MFVVARDTTTCGYEWRSGKSSLGGVKSGTVLLRDTKSKLGEHTTNVKMAGSLQKDANEIMLPRRESTSATTTSATTTTTTTTTSETSQDTENAAQEDVNENKDDEEETNCIVKDSHPSVVNENDDEGEARYTYCLLSSCNSAVRVRHDEPDDKKACSSTPFHSRDGTEEPNQNENVTEDYQNDDDHHKEAPVTGSQVMKRSTPLHSPKETEQPHQNELPRPSPPTSLELRKVPTSFLLGTMAMDDDVSFSQAPEEPFETPQHPKFRGLLRMTCLNPKLSLRSQLMLSFDSVHFITIFVVVLICVVASIKTSDTIEAINSDTFSRLAQGIQGRTARYLAESLEHRLIPKDTVQILYELTRDRFQGYPLFQDDSQVPFKDVDTNSNVYPIVGQPLPLDWQIRDPVTEKTDPEHAQGRRKWYGATPLSTANGHFVMQGACDPSETNVSSLTYLAGCTDASNDISTGGTMRPSNLTEMIHRKASDLVPTMKALYEYNQDVRDIGIYFANKGVGAAVNFPHYQLVAQNNYTSVGCEWMKEPNPYNTSRPIGSQEEIDQCYPEGLVLSAREYNPNVRAWYRDQALQPEKILTEGPFLAAWLDNTWIMSSGRAVYDRLTNELVACILVGVSIDFLDEIMEDSRITNNSEVSIVRWDIAGSVVASSARSTAEANRVLNITELGLGFTNETYNSLFNLVDYESKWSPVEVQKAYGNYISRADGFVVAAYPIPPIPDQYDLSYRPVFFAIISADEADVFENVREVNDGVESRERQAVLFAVVVGAAGFAFATVVILITATAITRPLYLMNNEAEIIVGSFGEKRSNEISEIKPIRLRYSRFLPHTEITDVVNEFNKMLSTFSGSSLMARSEREKYTEIPNMFDLRNDFMSMYKTRQSSDLPGGLAASGAYLKIETSAGPLSTGGEQSGKVTTSSTDSVFVHTGTNVKKKQPSSRRMISSKDFRSSKKQVASPLFIWTVILIVTPLLLTTITISAVVLSGMSREFDESVSDSEAHYLDVAIQALPVYNMLRASFLKETTSRSLRDLYLMTRVASWILFGGVELAGSFTEVMSDVNKCKSAQSSDSCPWLLENGICDCDWLYPTESCMNYSEVEGRNLQVPYFVASSDAALRNGTRMTTDYPENSVSPETTAWWDGYNDLPGSGGNETATSLSTTYSRVRTISAFPIFQVLMNYDIKQENSINHAFSFEEDGTFFADAGCFNAQNGWAAFWQSTDENGAARLRPELCPVGRYGYDPRCREWYDTGRTRAIQHGDSLYVTTPYVFAGSDTIAQTATSPFIDPRTGAHIGQVLQDFTVTDIFSSLTSPSTPLLGGFPLLLTPTTDIFGGDTVMGPGLNGSVSSQPASLAVMPYDQECGDDKRCMRRQQRFDEIAGSMKARNNSTEMFERTTADGGTELVYMAYTPIVVKYLDPVDPSDFTRGARVTNHFIYSLGFAETVEGILEPFGAIQEEMQRQINVAIGILAAVIVVAVLATIGISYLVARSISEPMACLLELIRLVNRRDVDQDPPMVDQSTGSKESTNVSNTMESLYRVVRLANISFYAGDLEAAYRVLLDVLRLFKRMDNKKAIGVACNNLGNTMLSMYREMLTEDLEFKFGVTRQEIVAKGTACFQEAIQLGEEAYNTFYDREGWSVSCLDFMQHLSNRYFNRGMFLLTVKDDHPNPEEIRRLGFRDLEISRDMDAEIESQGEESGWGSLNRLQKLFDVRLVRIRGYLLLLGDGYPDEWEVDEKFNELFEMLAVESTNEESALFDDVLYIGRMQQVETVLIKYLLIKGNVGQAANIAIRMLMEDKYVFLDAEVMAIKALLQFIEGDDCGMDRKACIRIQDRLDDILDELAENYESRRKTAASRRCTHHLTAKSCQSLGPFFESSRSTLSSRWLVPENSSRVVTMEQF